MKAVQSRWRQSPRQRNCLRVSGFALKRSLEDSPQRARQLLHKTYNLYDLRMINGSTEFVAVGIDHNISTEF